MLQGAVGAALGEKLVRALLFPLGYALLLVPFGEELVPLLQTFTAHISVVLLHLSGIAAEMQGVFITTKAGFFEELGRASCRERGVSVRVDLGGRRIIKKKKTYR